MTLSILQRPTVFLDSQPLPAYFKLSRTAKPSHITSPGPSVVTSPQPLTSPPSTLFHFQRYFVATLGPPGSPGKPVPSQGQSLQDIYKASYLLCRVTCSRYQDVNIFMGNYPAYWTTQPNALIFQMNRPDWDVQRLTWVTHRMSNCAQDAPRSSQAHNSICTPTTMTHLKQKGPNVIFLSDFARPQNSLLRQTHPSVSHWWLDYQMWKDRGLKAGFRLASISNRNKVKCLFGQLGAYLMPLPSSNLTTSYIFKN